MPSKSNQIVKMLIFENIFPRNRTFEFENRFFFNNVKYYGLLKICLNFFLKKTNVMYY